MGTIILSWPLAALSPNSRQHWSKVSRAKKAARAEGYYATKEALPGFKHSGGRIRFTPTAHPPDRRRRDDDNISASLKAYRDGIAEALGIDDSLFDQAALQWGEPVAGGRIVVSLTASPDP